MTRILRLIFAVLVAATLMPALPASAGDKEISYLRSLAGNFVGSGTVRLGRERVEATCRLALRPSGSELNVAGSCVGGDITGTIFYDDSSKRWISKTGNRGVVGRKSGRSLTFTTTERTENGNARSTFTFAPGKATLKFELVLRGGVRGNGAISFRPS